VSNDSLALWRLGYAPEGDRLARYLQEQGHSAAELVAAGLARQRETDRPGNASLGNVSAGNAGGLYDYFRNRLIFPIRDIRGQTIAFGGRELGGGHPKYLNTPQTPLFDKSATLYGLDLARDAIRRADRVVLVEGYMDAVVPHQYGSRNVVAVIGSAVTEKHIQQIKKLTRRVTLALDPDAAGESATVRGIVVAQEAFERKAELVLGQQDWSQHLTPDQLHNPGALDQAVKRGYKSVAPALRFEEVVDAEITVARLPAGEDPDEFVRRDTQGWQRALDEAAPLIDFLIEAQTAGLDLTSPHGKLEACRRLLPIIAQVRNRSLATDYIGRLATKLRMEKTDLDRDLQATRQRLDREARARPRPAPDGTADRATEQRPEGTGSSFAPGRSPVDETGDTASHSLPGAAGRLVAQEVQEEYCLGLLLEQPSTWPEVLAVAEEQDFSSGETRALYSAIMAAVDAGHFAPVQAFLDDLPLALQVVAQRCRDRVVPKLSDEGGRLTKAASKAAYRLKRTRLEAEIAELESVQRDAERSGDAEMLRSSMTRLRELLSLVRTIDKASPLHG
jgi:DNA primase